MEASSYTVELEERKKISEPLLSKGDRINVFFSLGEFKKKPGKKNLLITDQIEEKQMKRSTLPDQLSGVESNEDSEITQDEDEKNESIGGQSEQSEHDEEQSGCNSEDDSEDDSDNISDTDKSQKNNSTNTENKAKENKQTFDELKNKSISIFYKALPNKLHIITFKLFSKLVKTIPIQIVNFIETHEINEIFKERIS